MKSSLQPQLRRFIAKLSRPGCCFNSDPPAGALFATAKLLRDEAESLVSNIDPEQVRKLAGWGLTQNDRASFVGWSQSLISLGFESFYDYRRQAIQNGVEQGHGTQSNPLGMKDLWPSASRFWKNQARVRNGQQPRS